MIVGGDSPVRSCLFQVNPPITAFTMRITATPAPAISSIQVFDSDGLPIDCFSSVPYVTGTSGYAVLGAYSNNLIGSFSLVADSTATVQADNIQLLTCGNDYIFNGTDCVGKLI